MINLIKISALSFIIITSVERIVAGPGQSKPITYKDPATNLSAQRQKFYDGSTIIIARDFDGKRTTKTTISRSGKKKIEVIRISNDTDTFLNPVTYRPIVSENPLLKAPRT